MSDSRMQKRFLNCTGMTIEEAEQWGTDLCRLARDIPWLIGDLARFAESKLGENYSQVFPPETSPGMIERYKGVALLYPKKSDRQHEATFTQYMQNARKPDRLDRLQAIVDAGMTTDESRKADQSERANDNRPRWLLAVDVNYHLHRHWFSGAGVEAAVRVTEWLQRTVKRLQEKGMTDVVCCFDAPNNHRKDLTAGWEDKYKDRPPKDPELGQQLQLVRELLDKHGFCCVSADGFEADDIMASYANQFQGRTTILSADKDLRQCLSGNTNILLDVEWTEDETSGDMLPDYVWYTARPTARLVRLRMMRREVFAGDDQEIAAQAQELSVEFSRRAVVHELDVLISQEPRNLWDEFRLRPELWTDFQTIMGDTVDGIKGAPGIGEKGAADLITTFGTVEAAIIAAKADDERIKPRKREALIEFESKLDITRQLVALKTDLSLPQNTRI